jgi:toxin-antitoxin system PIN domain toxin
VKLLDANILLYAVNRDSAHHAMVKRWLDLTMASEETIALPWVVVLAFLRIATNPRALPKPLTTARALDYIDTLFAHPNVVPLAPGDDHWRTLRGLLEKLGAPSNLTTDAHLAALAIEHGAVLCSTDGDFSRFKSLQWENPIAA